MEDDPPYDIAVTRVGGQTKAELISPIHAAIHATLRRFKVPTATISVAIVDDRRIAELNAKHLQHEGPTDVLTFDLGTSHSQPDGSKREALTVDGEIVLSIETAQRLADERGHGVEAEAALYAVHGTLHLLGYDDSDDKSAAEMHAIEDEILIDTGVGPVYRKQVS